MSIRKRVSFLVFILGFMLSIQNAFSAQITKSPNDNRQYKSITLPNQLTVLLISDKNTDKAAAALDIKVGSGSDPEGYEGLAHFLEHMLFLGTKKYPDAGSYQAYINRHGGNHNAYTSFDNTNYFFDINANALEPALDRFSQQFVSPTFTSEYVTREINAVHSEYSAKLKDDSRLYFSAFKETVNPQHPYHNFSVGNLTTLSTRNDKNIRDVLIDFYQSNYSANLMKLVVLGKEPIDQLESWVTSKFSAIPNTNVSQPSFDMPLFQEDSLPALLKVSPTMDKRTLSLVFPIPSTKKEYRNKPTYFISNLIGHEGKGSLFSSLKNQGLVESLSAGTGIDTGNDAMFNISFRLTQKGLANWETIVTETFNYIELIKLDGINKHYFDEQKTMLDLAFKFSEKSEPIHYVSSLASTMQEVTPSDILTANYLMKTFDPSRYQEILNKLTPQNVLISLMAKTVTTDKKTKWYEAPYALQALTPEQLNIFTADSNQKQYQLPSKNDFIPENINLLTIDSMSKPELLEKAAGFTLWHYGDNSFGTPKSNIYVNLRSPLANNTAEHAVLNSLFTSMIQDDLNEFTYPAYLAGLNYDLYSHIRGLSIKIGGYSEKQTLLLENILKSIKTAPLRKERFEIYKEQMVRALENAVKKKPYQQTTGEIRKLILKPQWTEKEKLAAIESITITTLRKFRSQLLNQVEIVALSSGNISRAGSLNNASVIQSWLLDNDTQKVSVKRGEVAQLPVNKSYRKAIDIDHPDTGYTLYIQGNNKSYLEQSRFLLLSQILSSPYYKKIRTENQLGYIVFATNYNFLEVPGIAFIVQSPKANATLLDTETNAFLLDYSHQLASMPPQEFEQHKAALISRLFENENNLSQKSQRFWQEIDRENYSFNTREKLSTQIEKLTQENFKVFYNKLINSDGKRLLVFSTRNSVDNAPLDQDALIKYAPLTSVDSLWSNNNPF